MARKIVLTSGKGGVGKTTITANLGAYLAKQNKRVLLVDVDIGLNNLDVVMGCENKVVFDIVDVIEKRCRFKQAIIQDSTNTSLYILPSAHSYDKSLITKQNLSALMQDIDEYFDFILIDCPAGIEEGFHRAVSIADESIVVVTPHLSSLRDADKVIAILNSFNMPVKLIINRARGDLMANREMIGVDSIKSSLKVKLIGVIPEDDIISTHLSISVSGNEKNRSSRAFILLSENIIENTHKIYDCTISYKGALGLIKRKIKKVVDV